jgi:hypothetical protein
MRLAVASSEDDTREARYKVVDLDKNGAPVARYAYAEYIEGDSEGLSKEIAHLLAAAPEMLRLLKGCLEAFEPEGANEDLWREVRLTIARAEGYE